MTAAGLSLVTETPLPSRTGGGVHRAWMPGVVHVEQRHIWVSALAAQR